MSPLFAVAHVSRRGVQTQLPRDKNIKKSLGELSPTHNHFYNTAVSTRVSRDNHVEQSHVCASLRTHPVKVLPPRIIVTLELGVAPNSSTRRRSPYYNTLCLHGGTLTRTTCVDPSTPSGLSIICAKTHCTQPSHSGLPHFPG